MKKMLAALLTLCMAAALLSGCTQTLPAAGTPSTGTTTAGSQPASTESSVSETGMLKLMWSAAKGTDSIFESPWSDQQCLYPFMVFDALITADPEGNFIPRLAKEWSLSADGKVYTFILNEGVKWHDGEDFTAEDVAFSLYGILADPNSNLKNGFLQIEGAKEVTEGATTLSGVSVEGNTVTIKLLYADNSFLTQIACLYILPKHLLGSVAMVDLQTYESYWKKPVGTGAYRIDEVSFPDYFTCVRNESYFRAPAGIKNVLFTSYATGGNDAAVAALIKGDIHMAYGSSVNDITIANNVKEQNKAVKALMISSYQVRSFAFNLAGAQDGKEHPDIQKETVRQAFNLIIDKKAIADFYGEQAVPMTTFVSDASPMYNDDIAPFKRDVEQAVKMLKDANFDFSHPIRISYYYSDQTTADLMGLIKQNFAEAGITCEPALATGDLSAVLYKVRNYDLVYMGGGSNDPVQNYRRFLAGGTLDEILGDVENRRLVFNPLIEGYLATTDRAEMKKYADKLQVEGARYASLLPIYGLNKICLYNSEKLELPEEIFALDSEIFRDWKFEEWRLLSAD